ncbi:hypothetical protein HAX54_024052 [Datura stramonium]|uniref:Uncharacterized protein n=1 Tax=Datura stramonium TaxID=4076 RepID=A0ABS8UZI6_DATST|nr:hypothetical protein [Datura stramonium]
MSDALVLCKRNPSLVDMIRRPHRTTTIAMHYSNQPKNPFYANTICSMQRRGPYSLPLHDCDPPLANAKKDHRHHIPENSDVNLTLLWHPKLTRDPPNTNQICNSIIKHVVNLLEHSKH